ncbi:MAG: ribosome maturation factor RimP [Clostridiales bacterium]|nr:ribosome maturation factor RimP [Clostridiales bacterium]
MALSQPGARERRGILLEDKLTDAIAKKTTPILLDLGYDLVDLEFVEEGVNRYLRFFIEHLSSETPVSVDDCQRASEALSDWLDQTDPIPLAYFLEVSSPGIERRLRKERDFVRFQNRMVQIHTNQPVNGGKTHLGLLGPVTKEKLILLQDRQECTFNRDNITEINLYWESNKEE